MGTVSPVFAGRAGTGDRGFRRKGASPSQGRYLVKPKKAFDCVEMKRKAQEKIYEETKHLSRDELVEYFHRQVETGPFAHLWKRSKKTHSATRSVRNR